MHAKLQKCPAECQSMLVSGQGLGHSCWVGQVAILATCTATPNMHCDIDNMHSNSKCLLIKVSTLCQDNDHLLCAFVDEQEPVAKSIAIS